MALAEVCFGFDFFLMEVCLGYKFDLSEDCFGFDFLLVEVCFGYKFVLLDGCWGCEFVAVDNGGRACPGVLPRFLAVALLTERCQGGRFAHGNKKCRIKPCVFCFFRIFAPRKVAGKRSFFEALLANTQ